VAYSDNPSSLDDVRVADDEVFELREFGDIAWRRTFTMGNTANANVDDMQPVPAYTAGGSAVGFAGFFRSEGAVDEVFDGVVQATMVSIFCSL
jgi:hypothetical protein